MNCNGDKGRTTNLAGGVMMIDLMQGETVAAIQVGDSVWDQRVLNNSFLETLGPALQDIMLHVEMRDLTGSFGCRIAVQYKYEDGDWSTIGSSDVVFPEQSTADYHVANPFSDRSRLGRRRIRLVLQYHAKAGGSAGAKATLSISVACRPFCC